MPSLSALTIYFFGLSVITKGTYNLLCPSAAIASKGLPRAALPALNSFSVVLAGIGGYYCLAAYQENRTFFAMTLGRVASAVIFYYQGPGWGSTAAFEGATALLTGAAMLWESYTA